ncbi:hypothetical protein ACS0TY_020333 [Phlomoides rotata]
MAYVLGSNLCCQLSLHGFRAKKLTSKRLMVGVRYARQNNEEKSEKLKILIAGGGIGGLAFALAAKSSGFDVKVFEKDSSAIRGDGRGRGPIQLLSTALGLLQSIDKNVGTQVMEACCATCDRSNGLADGTTGEWLVKLDYGAPAVEKGIPVTQIICRMELQRILLNAVGDDKVINNSKVVDFVSDAHKVTVFLEKGEKHEGDILVGADGIRSMVRQKLFGAWEPKYSNFICYSGVAEFHPQYLPHFGLKIFVGTNQYFVAVDIGKGRMQWYAFVRGASQTRPIPSSGNKEFVVKCFRDWCNEVVRLINTTEDHVIISRLIHDIDMSSAWGRGRVVLLGDAAHAMLYPLSAKAVPWLLRIASVMTSFYHTYLHIPPLSFFNLRIKHPAFIISTTLLNFVIPKFMDWVVVGQE